MSMPTTSSARSRGTRRSAMAISSLAFSAARRSAVLFRLVLLSILVGVVLKVLGLDPLNIIRSIQDLLARDLEHGLRRRASGCGATSCSAP